MVDHLVVQCGNACHVDLLDSARHSLIEAALPTVKLSGFDADQLFFFKLCAELARENSRPALRDEIITDGHAPAQYRAFTVRNLDARYEAFEVKPGQSLYLAPADRVRVW